VPPFGAEEIGADRKTGLPPFLFAADPHMDACKPFGRVMTPSPRSGALPRAFERVADGTSAMLPGTGERRLWIV
jgi:hypothetical protein